MKMHDALVRTFGVYAYSYVARFDLVKSITTSLLSDGRVDWPKAVGVEELGEIFALETPRRCRPYCFSHMCRSENTSARADRYSVNYRV